MLVTIAVWILAHVAIALALGMPSYVACGPRTGGGFSSCSLDLGLTFLVVGVVQLLYGAVAGLLLVAFHVRKGVAQGVFIGMSIVVVLFTVVCFGATATG